MIDYYTGVLKNYAGFEGRARRAEFWQYALVNFVIAVVLAILGAVINFPYLVVLYYLGVLVPSLAVCVRRLHDTSKSGWWVFISFVPFVGGIILLVFTCMDSIPGANQFGPNPKGIGNPADQYAG